MVSEWELPVTPLLCNWPDAVLSLLSNVIVSHGRHACCRINRARAAPEDSPRTSMGRA